MALGPLNEASPSVEARNETQECLLGDATVHIEHNVHVKKRRIAMLYTLAIVLIVLWALGLVSSYTLGGFIHILLVLAIVVILFNLIGGRRVA
jgi:hypothetical protein